MEGEGGTKMELKMRDDGRIEMGSDEVQKLEAAGYRVSPGESW